MLSRLVIAVGLSWVLVGCRPTPVAIILATSESESLKEYAGISDYMRGWDVMSIDLPAHGADKRPAESAPLAAWRTRLDAGEDVIGDFRRRLSQLVDSLPNRPVALIGISRGRFLALHAAAHDPRITSVVAFMPVTSLGALTEFADSHYGQWDVETLAPRLAGRPVWMSIARHDPRVGTQPAIAAADALRATLLVEAAEGHI